MRVGILAPKRLAVTPAGAVAVEHATWPVRPCCLWLWSRCAWPPGVAGVVEVQHRRGVLDGMAERGSPLVKAAVRIYQSLADVDATADSVFLVGGQARAEMSERYRLDIAEAATALGTAAGQALGSALEVRRVPGLAGPLLLACSIPRQERRRSSIRDR